MDTTTDVTYTRIQSSKKNETDSTDVAEWVWVWVWVTGVVVGVLLYEDHGLLKCRRIAVNLL